MKLYTYFRSSAAYRVRIALNLKGLAYEAVPVHLLRDGGEQLKDSYRAVNPSALVPSLDIDGAVLQQSLAIIEYLDEVHPGVPLLPGSPLARARARALALLVACEIHPLTNLRVQRHLASALGADDAVKRDWYRHWVIEGLQAFEAVLAQPGPSDGAPGRFCVGDTPTVADCCLVPQLFNARRFEVDLAPYPLITAIDARCAELPAFQAAHPAQQADAE